LTLLAWYSITIDFDLNSREDLIDLARITAGVGFSIAIFLKAEWVKEFRYKVLLSIFAFSLVFYYVEEKLVKSYSSKASPELIRSAYAKTLVMSIVPEDVSYIDRISFRLKTELMSSDQLVKIIDQSISGDIFYPVKKQFFEDNKQAIFNLAFPDMKMSGLTDEMTLKNVENNYLKYLYAGAEIFQERSIFLRKSFDDYVINYLESSYPSAKGDLALSIWLMYVQSVRKIDHGKLNVMASEKYQKDWERLIVNPMLLKEFGLNTLSMNIENFKETSRSRAFLEAVFSQWLLVTIGLIAGLMSLILNIILLFKNLSHKK
jgi:hypothetical protein